AAEEGVVHWSGERGYGVRPPEQGQSPPALPVGSRLVGRAAPGGPVAVPAVVVATEEAGSTVLPAAEGGAVQ
ncbi:MAG: hypothetical protein ACYCTI_11380, partial [Acidimicrobiales bacterium]